MANPTVYVEVKSIGVEKTKREIRGVADEAERLEKINQRVANSGARKASEGIRRVGTSSRKAASQTEQATKALRQFDSRLGGARRASAQFAQAQDRLNDAYRAGLLTVDQYNERLAEARKRFTAAEVKSRDLRDNFRRLNTTLGSLRGGFGRLAGAVGPLVGAAGVAGFGALVTQSLKTAANLEDLAKRAGVTTAALQELTFAAQQYGVRQQTLIDGLRELQVRAGEFASGGGGEAKEAFERIGLSAQQAQRLVAQSDNGLAQIIQRIRELDSAAARAQAFDQLFGDEAGQALRQLTGDIGNLRAEARELGLVIDRSLIRQADDARDSFNTLTSVLQKRLTTAIANLAPALDNLFRGILKALPDVISDIELFAKRLGVISEVSDRTRIRELRNELGTLRKEFEALNSTDVGFLGSLAQSASRATGAADELNRRIADTAKELGVLTGDLDPLARQFGVYEDAANGAAQATDRTGDAAQAAGDPLRALGGDYADLRQRIEATTPAIEAQNAVLSGQAQAVAALGVNYDGLRKRIEAVQPAIEKQRQLLAGDIRLDGGDGVSADRLSDAAGLARGALTEREQAQRRVTRIRGSLGAVQRASRSQLDEAGIDNRARALELLNRRLEESRTIANGNAQALQFLERTGEQAFERIGSTITEELAKGQLAFKDLANVGQAVLSELTQAFIRLSLVNPLKNALFGSGATTLQDVGGIIGQGFTSLVGGGGASFQGVAAAVPVGARADGGPVDAGKPYVVGERGPELFTPATGGQITPNNALRAGGETEVNIYATGEQPEVRRSPNGNGGERIDVIFDKQAKRAVASGRLDKEMRTRYGITPATGTR